MNPYLAGFLPIMDRRSYLQAVLDDKRRQAASAFDRHLTQVLKSATGSNEFKGRHTARDRSRGPAHGLHVGQISEKNA